MQQANRDHPPCWLSFRRIASLVLALIMVFAILPAVPQVNAADRAGAGLLTAKTTTTSKKYVLEAIDRYLNENPFLASKETVFLFEGVSKSPATYSYRGIRNQAIAVIVNRGEIVYVEGNCSTIPDNPDVQYNVFPSAATVCDGIYIMKSNMHNGHHAFWVNTTSGSGKLPCVRLNSASKEYVTSREATQILVHERRSDQALARNVKPPRSEGCLLVGKTGVDFDSFSAEVRKQQKTGPWYLVIDRHYARESLNNYVYGQYHGQYPSAVDAFTPTHKFTSSTGKCDYCSTFMPFYSYPVTKGIYTLKVNSYSTHELPYKASPSVAGAGVRKGQTVIVDGGVRNGFNNIWYHVEVNGKKGYIYKDNLELKMAQANLVVCPALSAPSVHTQGNKFNISGTIQVSGCRITKVKAYFCNSLGKISGTETAVDQPNSSNYSLYKSKIDNNLKFGNLGIGRFCYCVEVTTSAVVYYNGSNSDVTRIYSPFFDVRPSSSGILLAPRIEFIDAFPDGVHYRITQNRNTRGASDQILNYYYSKAITENGGRNYTTTDNAVDLYITGDDVISAYSTLNGMVAMAPDVVVQLPELGPPEISSAMTGDGAVVTIRGSAGAKLYYSLDGGVAVPYTGAFTLTADHTVSAYAQKDGCITSDISECEVEVTTPAAPELVRATNQDFGAGEDFSVYWNQDSATKYYQVEILRNGETVKQDNNVSISAYTYQATEPGEYTIRVCAVNAAGSSAVSSCSAVAHAPCTVTFLNWDGSVWVQQTVTYGKSAVRPTTSPTRRGYSFDGWEGSYTNVTQDQTVQALFAINTYTVRFYDVNGAFLGTQQIMFDQSIDSAAMEARVNVENGGRAFSGWHIEYATADSFMDIRHVDCDMRLRAVTVWQNENLPVYVAGLSVSASISDSGIFNGYIVSGQISSSESRDLRVKIIVTLQNQAEDGSYKMIAASVVTTTLNAGSSNLLMDGALSNGIFVSTDGRTRADRAEVTVVSIEGDDRTGGLLSATAYIDIPISTFADVYWSDWMTYDELIALGYSAESDEVERKTQYRDQNNYQSWITNASSTPPSGYTYGYNASYWGGWTNWSSTYVAAIPGSREVETRQVLLTEGHYEYRYGTQYGARGEWCCNQDSALHQTYTERYTNWSTTRYSKNTAVTTCGYVYTASHPHTHYAGQLNSGGFNNGYHKDFWYSYDIDGIRYYWEESRWVPATYRTEYRYRDYIPRYYHYIWVYGSWSDWTDTVLTDPDTSNEEYVVQTRYLYRHKIYDVSGVPTDTDGVTKTVSGTLDAETMGGKLVSVFVYRSKNADPTASQLEYVGQTTVESDGAYSISFRTKEEPTNVTGDYVVSLAAEGADSLVNVELIPYVRPRYTVTFCMDDGEILLTEQVTEGEDANLPEAPVKAGYIFCGWNGRTTNIQGDVQVTARFSPKTHSAVFVDYVNQSCEIVSVTTGEPVVIPENLDCPTAEGYEFQGWSGYEPGMTITENQVFTAEWNIKQFTVSFHDAAGDILTVQQVNYGAAAEIPMDIEVPDNLEFLGWSDESCWWRVTEDIDVLPIIVYKQTTGAPASNLDAYCEGVSELLVLTAEPGADIYYTLDGSQPDPLLADEEGSNGTYHYTSPITLDESAVVYAIAVAPEKNESDMIEITFNQVEEYSYAAGHDVVQEVDTFQVDVQTGTLVNLEFCLTGNPGVKGTTFFVHADPTVFGLFCDAETGLPVIDAKTLCDGNGSIGYDVYNTEYGWAFTWSGENATSEDGSLFSIWLIVDNEIDLSTQTISVSYPTDGVYTETDNRCDLLQSLSILVSTEQLPPPQNNPFADVQDGAYYYEPILWAVENGITVGTSETTFSPNQSCTRAQIVTFLWRAAGSPTPTIENLPFTDVPETAYYYDAVRWAYEQGITSGVSDHTFGSQKTCNRAEAVTLIWRAAGSPAALQSGSDFTDVPDNIWFSEAVSWAVENGITVGTGETTFSPYRSCTRAQIVTFLYRYLVE